MRKRLWVLGIFLLCFIFIMPFGATAFAYSHIVAFGDSLTDGGFWGAPATDDKVWVEYLADNMGITLDNRAIGGAKTTGGPIDLDSQIAAYLGGVTPTWNDPVIDPIYTGLPAVDDPDTLFSVWIGGNDCTDNVLNGNPITAQDAVDNMIASMGSLYASGARNFLVFNLPDVGSTPYMQIYYPGDVAALTQFAMDFNNALYNVTGLPSDINIHAVDAFTILNENYSLELFYTDGFHPSSVGHNLIADAADAAIAPVPVPAAIWLFSSGLIGLVGIRRRLTS